jgi:branched-chain amino acid transport system permease protein
MNFSAWFGQNELFVESTIISVILACSVQVVLRAGVFSLASIGFYQAGTYTAAVLVRHGWPAPAAIALAVVVAGLGGWILSRVLVRLHGLYLAMATIAFDLIIGVIALNWGSITGGALGLYGIPAEVSFTGMVIVLLLVVAGLILLERGPIGRMFEMARDEPQVGLAVGVDPHRPQRLAFIVSAGLGALAGAIHALSFYSISPGDVSFQFVILVLAMAVIGGSRSWLGAVIGAVIVVWVPLKLSSLGNDWPVVYGAVMVVVAVYFPDGVLGVLRLAAHRIALQFDRPAIAKGSS